MNPTSPTWDCTEARPSLGVYVLGAIDPAERTLVDHHLATCRDCRDELAGLAGLPALLARVNPDEVSRIRADDTVRTATEDRPSGELLGTVLDLAEARRRRTRWRFLATAAAVVVLAGGLFGGLRAATSSTHTVYAAQYPDRQLGQHPGDQRGHRGERHDRLRERTLGPHLRGPRHRHTGRNHVRPLGRPPRRDPHPGGGVDDGARRRPRLVPGLDGRQHQADQRLPDHRRQPGPAHGHLRLTAGTAHRPLRVNPRG
jgi:hypothetical protein